VCKGFENSPRLTVLLSKGGWLVGCRGEKGLMRRVGNFYVCMKNSISIGRIFQGGVDGEVYE
jgi:hypothetical protein